MSAQFFGLASAGTSVIAIKGTIRLSGILLREFEGAAGALSAVQIGRIEVLAGEFPGNIDQVTLNANGWDIYREEVDELPPLPESGDYDRFIEALNIFRAVIVSTGGESSDHYFAAEHDTIYGGVSPDDCTEAQLQRLEELGWYPDGSTGSSFYYFT